MSRKYFAFGSLLAEYTGELSLLTGTALEKFSASPGRPDFTVELRQEALPSCGDCAKIAQMPDGAVYRKNGIWHRRFVANYNGDFREYAVVEYTDRTAVLTVAPDCGNVPQCVESCTAFEHLALSADALPLHASHIQIGGRAILFTAPSGTGKSTQAALWQEHRGAEIINGDKALLLCGARPIFASGLPYSGTSGICRNAAAELQAIVVLQQGKKNVLTRLSGGRAVIRLMTGVICQNWHENDAEKALSLAIRTVETVPIYSLSCLPDESAVACLETALQELSKEEK